MSAPAGTNHQDARAALLEIYQILRGAALRARQQAATDTADQLRPLGAGDQPAQHNDRASRPRDNAAVAEDVQHDRVMPAAD